MTIKSQLKETDIYIIDQILKGNFDAIKSVLDVGCGKGRNLTYFLQNDFNVFGLDPDENRVSQTKRIAQKLNSNIDLTHFRVGLAEDIPFEESFDLIICNAVLHFSKNKTHFEAMLFKMWEKLNKDGILFIRLASDIGIENLVESIGNGNYKLPDASKRYLVSEKDLLGYTKQLNATLIEPIKTTNVQSLRCMTTWVLKKPENR